MKTVGVLLLAVAAALIAGPRTVVAQQGEGTVIYLVRHAETAPDGTQDPPLSGEGRARAARLAAMLGAAGLDAVHTTPYRRTRGTADAVASAAGLEARVYDPRALDAFAADLVGEGGRHLVVGHSNTTPALVRALGGDPGSPIPETEYGRVYVLTLTDGEVHTALLGYPEAPATARPGTVDPEDVATLDAILAALYDVISGPAGQPRDWDRMRGLFLPTARLIPVQRTQDGRTVVRAITPEEYIASSGPMLTSIGFREREVARRIDRFGDVAQVFSTYEGHREGMDAPVTRGINSIQLVWDGQRWWISSLAWSAERPDLQVPPEYEDGGR